MKNLEKSIINFSYFTANFTPNFIKKCWEGNDHLIQHLENKFITQSQNSFISVQGFMNFFFDLDRENQIKLVKWVDKNYNGIER